MAFEAFPRHATGLTFANFSIKAFESPRDTAASR